MDNYVKSIIFICFLTTTCNNGSFVYTCLLILFVFYKQLGNELLFQLQCRPTCFIKRKIFSFITLMCIYLWLGTESLFASHTIIEIKMYLPISIGRRQRAEHAVDAFLMFLVVLKLNPTCIRHCDFPILAADL